jgi:hypothetical protein
MSMMKFKIILICLFVAVVFNNTRAQLIQGTIKSGTNDSIEIWIKPDFNNTTQYLFQLGFPIAFPANANPTGLNVKLDPGFIAVFGNNYSVTINPVTNNTTNTEKYFNIVLVRTGANASTPQNWTSGSEFKVLAALFTPSTSPAAQVKLADYQDGGIDEQGNFYTMDGNANYYVSTNSSSNFYASPGQSVTGGSGSEGFAQTIALVPCTFPVVQPITGTTTIDLGQTTQLSNATPGGVWSSDAPGIATIDVNGLVTGITAGSTVIHYTVTNGCGTTDVIIPVSIEQRLIAGTIRKGGAANEMEVWIKPYFSNSTQYLFQLGFPIAFPVSLDPQINAQDITLDLGFRSLFGENYSVTVNPMTQNTAGTEKYYNIVLVRNGSGASVAQGWVNGTEIKVFTATIRNLTGSVLPKLADYQDGGMDGQANFYTMDGNGNYYVVSNSAANFYGVAGQSAVGGNAAAGYAQIIPAIAPVCTDPTGLTVGSIHATDAQASWNPVAGALEYEISITISGSPIPGTSISGTTYNAPGLIPGTKYYAQVRAICAPGIYSSWVSTEFTTVCTEPPLPDITGIITTGASVSWATVPGVTGYQHAVTISDIAPGSGTFTTNTSFPASGLSAGTVYYVHIRSVCSPGVFSVWKTTSFTTAFPPCNPTFILPIPNVTNLATITWTPLSSAVGYEYSVSTTSTPPVSGGTPTAINNFTATGLNSATKYFAHVRVQCGPGRYSSWYTREFVTPCFKPIPFVIETLPTAGTAELAWHKINGALKYEYAVLGDILPPGGSLSFTNDTVLHVTGLRPGGKYYLHVRTLCAPGNSSQWSMLEFNTTGVHIYPNPTNSMLTVTAYGTDIVDGEVELFDAVGKLLRKARLSGGRAIINMGMYATGIYFIRYGNETKYLERVIKR